MTAVALLVAAGRGERLGADRPKAFVTLGDRPLIEWSLEALRAAPSVGEIVVALPDGVPAPQGVSSVVGGATRSESVRNALQAAGPGAVVVIHDAARPLLTPEIVERCVTALGDFDAAIAAARVTDTTKEADRSGLVTATLDRERLWAVQTPQVFRRAALEAALSQPADILGAATDDASLVERAGGRVRVVECSPDNLKVTSPRDLRLAELLLADRLPPASSPG